MTLQSEIEQIIAQFDGHWGIIIRHLDEPVPLIVVNPYDEFEAASTAKLPIILHVLNLLEVKQLRWEDVLILKKDHKRSGTGVLRHWPKGYNLNLGQAVGLMLVESDNTATNVVLDYLGGSSEVNKRLAAEGIEKTGLMEQADRRFLSGPTTPNTQFIVLRKIFRHPMKGGSWDIFTMMMRCHFRAGLRREFDNWQNPYQPPLPSLGERLRRRHEPLKRKLQRVLVRPTGNSNIANKEGSLDYHEIGEGFRHDVALFLPNGLLVAAFSRGWPELGYSFDHPALITLGKIGQAVYHWKE